MDKDSLTRRRGAERAVVTKTLQKIGTLFENNAYEEILPYKPILEEKLQVLKGLNQKLIDIIDGTQGKDNEEIQVEMEAQITEAYEVERKIWDAINKINKIEGEKEKIETLNASMAALDVSVNKKQGNVRLPKLTLKKFNGDLTEFPSWLDAFKQAVDSNDDLQPVDKLIYLKSLLGDKPSETIKGLQLTGANYTAALDILRNRFGDKQTTISNHMERFINLPTIKSSKDIVGLRKFSDQIESTLRSLTTLGIDSRNYGALLIPIVLNRLPDDIRLLISRKYESEDNWVLKNLLETLDSEIKARERCEI